jgi:GH24 family phage-related lysozyme (muramidase)
MAVLPQIAKAIGKAGTKAADELIPVGLKQGNEAAPVVAKTQPREADDLTKLNEQQVFEKYQDTSGMPPARATQADPKAVPQSQIIPAFQKLPDANARGLERYSNDTQEEMLGVMRLPQSNSTLMSVSLGDLADLIQHTKGVDSSRAPLRGTDEGFANGKLVKPIVVEATIEGGTIVPKSILHGKSTLKYMAEEGKEIDRALTTALVQFTDEAGIPLPISGLKEIPETLQLGGRAIEADLPLLSRKSVSNPKNTAPTRETIEQYFQPQAIAQVEREASGNSRTTIAMLTPRQFLALAQDGKEAFKAARVAKARKDGEAFDEIPFLHINMYEFREAGKPLANVEGHEGRHRMRQLIEEGAGDTPMPVAIEAREGGELDAPRWSNDSYVLPAFIRKEGSKGRRFNYDAEALPFPKTYPTLDEALAASAPPPQVAGAQGGKAADIKIEIERVEDSLAEARAELDDVWREEGEIETAAFDRAEDKALLRALDQPSEGITYHVTRTENVAAIKKEGLQQFKPSNWANNEGERLGSGDIYAFKNYKSALGWAFKMDFDFYKGKSGSGDISILAINSNRKWATDPAEVMVAPEAVMTDRVVSADEIVGAYKVTTNDYKSLRDDTVEFPQEALTKDTNKPKVEYTKEEEEGLTLLRERTEELEMNIAGSERELDDLMKKATGVSAAGAAPVAVAGQIDENSPVAKFISSKELSSSVPLLKVYEDATKDSTGKGIPTVGHGHAFGHYNEKTKKNVIKTKEVAAYNKLSPADQQKQVDKWFREDLQAAEKSAQKFAGNRWSQLTDGQKLALTSLAFNVGDLKKKAPKAFAALKNNDFAETAHQLFSKAEGFVNAGGQYKDGLYKRRQAELAYWDGTN